MLNSNFISMLSQQAAKLFPAAAGIQQDLQKNLSALLKDSFEKLDLVTREEFDSQVQALEQAKNRIGQLERLVASLEAKFIPADHEHKDS